MGDVMIRALGAVALAGCAVLAVPGQAAADDGARRLFTFKDPRITESSGLAVSPTHDGIYYTHNDSSATPTFYAVDGKGRTKATFQVRGAEARDWEAMAASKDPETGQGVLWFADIGDNLDGAWPDVSVYRVVEPRTLADATLPATRYRFRYADGARNAEGIMVNPRTGRLYVVSKEFAGSVYAAPKKLRTGKTNVLRRVASAPLMATDAAYAPDGSSYVVRTYFSATLYHPSGKSIAKVSMPDLRQAESITYTADGKALLTGTEGPNSPVYRVPIPSKAVSTPRPTPTKAPASQAAAAETRGAEESGTGSTVKNILIWLAAAATALGTITFIARRTR
ncbi:hypothetical protein FH608_029645 [Nonomuraea phyllanthi]|uniref:Esterase-like activity of phytase family protein n=1 Tax=Nonomuraea phyllanthi TaxID=2219224 RepID=A0A5C4W1R6_9ACTN|nr:hypothetical protein [Nonomuraea phyllanthi]KAB8191429.1 hypothetical protein FH608_029645 [Nonomuraea phyllanthi]